MMVLVSMTILTIMGTLFTTIAMRSYQYSYSRMCRQQAYYTATSSIESLYAKIKTNGGVLNDIVTALDNAYTSLTKGPSEESSEGSSEGSSVGGVSVDITTVRVKIGSTHGDPVTEEKAVVGSDFFYTYLGECDLWARYNNAKRTEISLEAEATYNGYSETARAIISRTNGAASELKKIFDNTFCLQSPISTIVAETTHGDIYVSQPLYERSAGTLDGSYYHLDDYDEVVAGLTLNGKYTEGNTVYKGKAGQYLRDDDGNIITDTNTNAGKYNLVLKDGVYRNAQASTADGTLTGHTKPFDMDNSPLTAVNIDQPTGDQLPEEGDLWYNDWVELYMFSAVDGGTAVNGDLYADSKILIGLIDRNDNNRNYRRVWKDKVKRSAFSATRDAPWTNNYLMDPEFNELKTDADFEHGFGNDVFFDHENTILTRSVSKFRLNGDMYLWEDARIENFDSAYTMNALKGIKNNIYAYKDLYIDGLHITDWDGASISKTSSEVTIYGDVVVQGNAQIMNATIYGDVYCYGDKLTIVSSDIYGNVYFDGEDFTADTMVLHNKEIEYFMPEASGLKRDDDSTNVKVHGGGNLVINYTGKNTNVSNYDASAGFGTTKDVGGDNTVYSWGATITNCHIYGTLWSNVNTHILCSKWEEGTLGYGGELPDYYGNIYVDAYLFIDLTWTYFADAGDVGIINTYYQTDLGDASGHRENWNSGLNNDYSTALRFNCFEALDPDTQKIYAERFQFRLNQTDLEIRYDADVSHLGTLLVGGGGLYIDGNPEGHDDYEYWWKESTQFKKIYSMSSAGSIWECTVDGGVSYNASAATVAGNLKSGTKDITTALGDLYKELMPNGRETAIDDVKYDTFDKNGSVGKVWKDKLIKIRTWTAPIAGNATQMTSNGLEVQYYGEEVPTQGGAQDINIDDGSVADYIKKYPSAFSVSADGDTLTISASVTFGARADFSAYKRVIFDTSKGNIYVKFMKGAVLGNEDAESYDDGAEVVLTGGSMVFWYLYESDSYVFKKPTLQVNPYTRLGLVSAATGSGYGYDGLYIISNDDSLITMGQNAVLNGFVYTPHGAVYVAPAESSYTALNGCMAIESLILLNTADELPQGSIFDQIEDWFREEFLGGGSTSENVDALVKQYENIIFNYVQPPLITDWVGLGALTSEEVQDFGAVVWEFLGYY